MSTLEMWQRIGQEVSALMVEQGWTVSGLARKADVDPSTVQDFLDGKFGTVRAAEQICQAFSGLGLIDVIATVLAKEKEQNPPNPRKHLLLRRYDSATPEGQKLIESLLTLVPQQISASPPAQKAVPPRNTPKTMLKAHESPQPKDPRSSRRKLDDDDS
jgi:transcriptional regulator with XRE-family HTH domain